MDESCLLFDEEHSVLKCKSYNLEIRTDHTEIVADEGFQVTRVKEEHWFRGSSRLNTNDCIVGNMTAYSLVIVLILK